MTTLEAVQDILDRKQPRNVSERIDQMMGSARTEHGFDRNLIDSKIELLEAVENYILWHSEEDAIATLNHIVKTIKGSL